MGIFELHFHDAEFDFHVGPQTVRPDENSPADRPGDRTRPSGEDTGRPGLVDGLQPIAFLGLSLAVAYAATKLAFRFVNGR